VGVWIKIDVGYGRTGIPAERADRVLDLAGALARVRGHAFRGLLTHSGHSYHATSREEIEGIYEDTVDKLTGLRGFLEDKGVPRPEISIGDTPTCSTVEDFSMVDEIRPGNFVFYDAMQWGIGSCEEEDIALAVACPVVARHPERGEVVIYGGAVHLSKDVIQGEDGAPVFGFPVFSGEKAWGRRMPGCRVTSLTQEHGVVRMEEACLRDIRVGDILLVIPVHSCLAVNLLKSYFILEEGRLSGPVR
jgi:D-serine deaminase-like pyridoxal phosphate-dependent protein